MYYGRGAGKLPTASAVVGDVIEAAKNQGITQPIFWSDEKVELLGIDDVEHRFFVRCKADAGVEKELTELFGEGTHVVSTSFPDEVGFVTGVMTEKEFNVRFAKLTGAVSRIRMEA